MPQILVSYSRVKYCLPFPLWPPMPCVWLSKRYNECVRAVGLLRPTAQQPPPSGVNTGLGHGFCLSLRLSVCFTCWVASFPKLVRTQVSETSASLQWSWTLAEEVLDSPDRRTGQTVRLQKPYSIRKTDQKHILQGKRNTAQAIHLLHKCGTTAHNFQNSNDLLCFQFRLLWWDLLF